MERGAISHGARMPDLNRKRWSIIFPMHPHRIFIASLLLVVTCNSVPAAPETSPSAAILARIGDTDVKVDEIRDALDDLEPRERAALARDPALLNQTVRSLLVRRLVLKEALGKHWEDDPAALAQIKRARDNAIIESYLQSVSKAPAGYPSDADTQAAYDANKAALVVPRQYRLAQIFIAMPKGDDKAVEKAKAKLESVKKSLRQRDADFAAIAKAQSEESESAGRGGELGWLTEMKIQPEIRPQVTNLAKSAVSEPIQLGDGWHILKLLDSKEAYTPGLDEIREQLVQQLRAERVKAGSQTYLGKLLQRNPIAINELALSNVLKGSGQ